MVGADSALLQLVAQLLPLSPALDAELRTRTGDIALAKGQWLHQAGRVCHRTFLVTQGLLRSYYCKGEQDITDGFAAEGDWLTATSLFTGKPDHTYLQALEPSRVECLTAQDLDYLFRRFPEMERFGRITLAQQLLHQANRLTTLQFTSAREKYAHFCAAYPALLPRLPLGLLASYLGITQETLSRIRRAK